MRQLQHKHVVVCLDSFLVLDKLFIVMEFMPLTLLDLLESHNGGRGLAKDIIRRVMFQICKVMTFIHDQVRHKVDTHPRCIPGEAIVWYFYTYHIFYSKK